MKKTRYIVVTIIILIIFAYVNLPVINPRYSSTYTLIILLAIMFILRQSIISMKKNKAFKFKGNQIYVDKENLEKPHKHVIFRVGFLLALLFIIPLISSPLFFSSKYASLIGEVDQKDFSTDFSNPELDELPIVDSSYAKLLGDKKLGTTSGLGSEFKVGEYTDIIYKGDFYIIAPLEYNDFFKWLNNRKDGTPGYILINKSTAKVELVTSNNKKNVSLKYVDSAYFNQDLLRKGYISGGWNNRMSHPFFEIDDNGVPYFIIPKIKKTIGISAGDDVYQVIVINATDGDTNVYNVGEQPEWIDNVYPADLVNEQLNYYGQYMNGFWNSIFAQEGLLRTTEGSRHIYNNEHLSVYTGMTSVGADESTVGTAFVDVTNKGFRLYSLTGATEVAAMKSAEGKVQNLRYFATFPIPVNINDDGAYFITLKDDEGLIKQYSFVNINDYSIVENDTSLSQAYLNYTGRMGYTNAVNTENSEEQTGKVLRISSEISDNKTIYIILVDVEGENYIYISKKISNELPLTVTGDEIKFRTNGENLIEFDNLNIDSKDISE